MARSKDKRINRLRALRRKWLRVAGRAHDRNAPQVRKRALRRAQAILARIRKRRHANRQPPKPVGGLGKFDGKTVAAWIIPFLQYARAHGWKGSVTSGYRTYAEQWRIYYVLRIRPAALPGRSNHEGFTYPRGAVDVSDPWRFAAITRHHVIDGKQIKWYGDYVGPNDPWHMSGTGH